MRAQRRQATWSGGAVAAAIVVMLMTAAPPARGQCEPEETVRFSVAPPDPYDALSVSVALDHDTLLIGSPFEDFAGLENAGAVKVFGRVGEEWVAQGQFTAPDAGPDRNFGSGVALNGDTALVAGGYVFVRVNGEWTLQTILSVPDATSFGWPAAISGDTALVMGYWPDPNQGGALIHVGFVFVRVGDVWTEQARLIPPEDEPSYDYSCSVALDGDTALIAVPTHPAEYPQVHQGRAYVYERTNGAWSERGQLMGSDVKLIDFYGCSAALSGDTALVGAWSSGYTHPLDGPGAAYVFVRTGGAWVEQAKLTPAEPLHSEHVGYSVALDGDTALLGTDMSNIVLVYARADGTWTEQATILKWGEPYVAEFGRCLALDGNTAAIGADDFLYEEYEPGGAYVYNLHCASTPGDLNGDGFVDLDDLAQLLGHYGMIEGATYADGDVDGDGDVDLGDLAALLGNYGG
jgi:hypothetical protein